MKKLFTSESVTEGHPDKICDQISDAILDEMLKQDPMSRVACETFATTGLISVIGEVTTNAYVDIQGIARNVVNEIGYSNADFGFNGNTCAVLNSIHSQSPDIALGVDKSLESKNGEIKDRFDIGAGDQGLMFGYACNETKELMPLPIQLAHTMAKQLSKVRKEGIIPYLGPDGKTQLTIEYEGNKPIAIDTIVVSSQHSADTQLDQIRKDITKYVINPIAPQNMITDSTKIYINPTGRFVIGGPMGDTGLTGRKIIVDTYGGYARHGGGCFSGKDPTKVDRSACYMARYIAKNIVKAGLADRCEVQLAYAIGVAKPVSVMIDTFGTSKLKSEIIADKIISLIDLRPAAIIDKFNLRRPIYRPLASYGHMGREDLNAPWEALDLANNL